MTSLALKTPAAIKGRASFSGDLPSIQMPVVNTPREVPKYPNATPPTSPHETEAVLIQSKTVKYVISESSMNRFAGFISDLRTFCNSLSEVNFCPVIHEVELVEQVDILDLLFKPFYTETLRYLHALHLSEIDNTYVGSSALKQVAFPFVDQWKQFVQLINKVRDNGIHSMAKYLHIKFEIIYGVIRDIASNQKRDSVHIEEVKKAAATLNELVIQIDEGISFLILKTDLKQMAPDVLEAKIRDLRTLYRLYESEHNSEFSKSGFSICDLLQLRSNVQSAILDIIGGLKAAFSFHDDIEKIYSQVDEIQKMLTRVSEQINLPQTVVHTAKKKVITDPRLLRKRSKDPLKDVKNFLRTTDNKDAVDIDSHIVICGKLDLYIDKVCDELGIPPFDNSINVWERLNMVQEQVIHRIKSSKELEREYSLFQEKIQTQSGHITNLMKTNNKKTAECEEIEKRLNQKIADLEDRNQEMMKQRNDALTITKKREEQLFKLRLKYNENGTWKALQEVTQVLSRFLGIPIPDSKDIPKSAMDLSFTLNKRGCVKCHQHEDMEKDIRKRIERIIPIKEKDSLVNIISGLLADYQRMKYQSDMSHASHSHIEDGIKAMQECLKLVEVKSNEVLQINNEGLEKDDKKKKKERSILEMVKDTSNSFLLLLNMHKREMESLKKHFDERRQNELSSIMSKALSLFHPEKVSESDDVVEMILDILKNSSEQYDDCKLENRNKDDMIEKVTNWLRIKTNTEDDQSIEKMMTIIDKKENPLENVVYEQQLEKNQIQQEIHLMVTKIKGICGVNEQTDYMELNNLIKYANVILDKLHDKVEMENNSSDMRAHEDDYIIGELSNVISRFKNILDNSESIDFSKETTNSLLKRLHILIDQLTSEKQYIQIDVINQLTDRLRNEEINDLPHSLDPREYLPMISQKIEPLFNTINLIKKLLNPMLDIFKNFDFKLKSYDPSTETFNSLKTSLLEMHNVLKNDMKGEMVTECVTFLSKNMSLISALVGFIGIAFSQMNRQEPNFK
ncbi:hypothetical protein M9Y10_016319 [Tritrichomonas musculus]|uniref:Uncharacterized protein n=1 Tax=Tritrichomonas musculus TaxID=1915356 RepID=A0ABR2HW93_9EUKA